jgi:hypothetical protein
MKRILLYTVLFCVSLIVMCATIYAMNVAFWISLSVFALSCCLMARDHKMLEGEIEDLDNMF